MGILDRIAWLLWRRPQLKRSGSAAHWMSFVCPGSHLDGYNKIGKGSLISKSRLGRFSYVASAKICRTDMGSFCSVGPGVIIGGLGAHPLNWLSTHPAFYSTKMQAGRTFSVTDKFMEERSNKIGSDVWIGANALILDGVQVGDGAIIAAGAVVAKDVPPFAVVGGVPSKVIRFRFDEDVIEQLLSWKWWDLPEKEIAAISRDFSCRDQWTTDDVLSVQEQLKASKAPQ